MTNGIVFIHAFPLDGSMWADQLESLGRDALAIAPDLPGFGGAPGAGSTMTMDAAADHVARAAREAGIDRATFIGLSMGGYVALALWRRHRRLVRGFVFANTKAEGDDEPGKERRRQLADRLEAEGSAFLVESPPPLLSGAAPATLREDVRRIMARQRAGSIAAAARGMADRPDSTPDLAGVSVPTLVITSSDDTLIPPAATKPLADGIRGARFETIPGAGHLSNLEAPRAFNDLVRSHLRHVGP